MDADGVASRETPGPTPAGSESRKRPAQDRPDNQRKRAKYTTVACNQCKKGKIKCIRQEHENACQRCATMGAQCIIMPSSTQSNRKRDRRGRDDDSSRETIEEIAALKRQVAALTTTVSSLVMEKTPRSDNGLQYQSPIYSTTASQSTTEPKEPQFIGPTRPAFSLNIAETSLNNLGIRTDTPRGDTASTTTSSRESSPEFRSQPSPRTSFDCLLDIPGDEIFRLLNIYYVEVVSVHPFIDVQNLQATAPEILRGISNNSGSNQESQNKDVHILKLAIATALLHEVQGRNDTSSKLMQSVEPNACRISNSSEVELKDLQIMTMLSLYYFHVEEELFAWRAIGTAARQTLEMGLHRKQSFLNNFKTEEARTMANIAFWVVYTLDRRWSFGTSLPFALFDREIDPELPEPGEEFPYLRCLVTYGRLCSKVWEALPPFGSRSQIIPKETEDFLDFLTQNWASSIPSDLRLQHPSLDLNPSSQPRTLRRLRVLLHLRANHMRALIHRHHVLSAADITADIQSAQLVTEVARDSIQVLVHLNETSDIYVRQQSVFNYYLLSSLAIILLAVCHAPGTFAEPCRDAFLAAVELVKGFSRHGSASRRLWKSIRGLIPGVKSLGLRGRSRNKDPLATVTQTRSASREASHFSNSTPNTAEYGNMWTPNDMDLRTDFNGSVPDLFDMSSGLVNLFDAFGQGPSFSDGLPDVGFRTNDQDQLEWDANEISRRLQGLI
ncbi:hypothetical protein BS50DRAFT_282037 [Corynespora cassiicola Philippines]|uniref:Zn(2)-C6 fungal-type domain-containing protein n=1 Tax=Corynespora cassiicola Philippines TaxID=1448308 RepID=A0A2T2P184_CORCC|nr:hypothetical protein BS50DRAFT_282037 [Corynespora cassiicola Philippines]